MVTVFPSYSLLGETRPQNTSWSPAQSVTPPIILGRDAVHRILQDVLPHVVMCLAKRLQSLDEAIYTPQNRGLNN